MTASDEIEQLPFQVKVVCRFRPGEKKDDQMLLPLHQYLELQKKKAKTNSSNSSGYMLGENDPVEYMDPFLNILLKEPVKLLTSHRIVEKSVAMQCLRKTGRDPFNNKLLTYNQIVPQTDLQQEIHVYKCNKSLKLKNEVSLTAKDMKPLIDENDKLDPELLKAIVDSERMEYIIHMSEFEANKDNSLLARNKFNSSSTDRQTQDEDLLLLPTEVDPTQQVNEIENMTNNMPLHPSHNPNIDHDSRLNNTADNYDNDDTQHKLHQFGKNAKVVDLNEEKGVVNMYANGVGIKAFHFAHVFGADTSQTKVYNNSLKDSVVACLNGYNTALLCYGQTG